MLIGDTTAEDIKKKIGCVFPRVDNSTVEVKGRCLLTGLPKMVSISSSEIIEAFEEVSQKILDAVHEVLENTPPELVADISVNGIVMSGGCSLIWGLDKLITSRTGIEAVVVDDPLACAAYGAGKMLRELGNMQEGMINLARRKQMK